MYKFLGAISLLLIVSLGLITARGDSQELAPSVSNQPVELGQVEWIRDFESGVTQAKSKNKPLLVLFQEVPGCSTASGYGRNVLSHPLIVEAIETLFVPVAIYNNTGGDDRKVLDSFGEPSWNNPVVRIMTPDRNELTPRLSGNYTKAGLVNAMVAALKSSGQEVPQYLSLLAQELSAKSGSEEKAVLAMHCFWTGEAKLGNIKGVTSTRPGFMGGYEVVELEFNPGIITYEQLLKKARSKKVASHIFTANGTQSETAKEIVGEGSVSNIGAFRADRNPKYYLSRTTYSHVPMIELQKARVNAAIGSLQSPDKFLSPRQLELLGYIAQNDELDWPDTVTGDFDSTWEQAVSLVNSRISRR